MRKLALLAALLLAPAAGAGGWATVQLTGLPTDVAAGGTWKGEMTVLRHGRTPLNDVQPVIRISNGSEVREFPATYSGKPGVYRFEVVFPSAGTWQYHIWDGFSQTHSYKPVEIVAAGAGGGDGFPSTTLFAGLAAALALGAATYLMLRRRLNDPRPELAKS